MKKKRLLQPIDKLIIIYCLINIFYILLGIFLHGLKSERLQDPLKHLTMFFITIITVNHLIRLYQKFPNRFWEFAREWYVILFFVYFFETTTALNQIIFPGFFDNFFQRIDQYIFGYQPAAKWGLSFNNYLISEIMHFAYFSYYLSWIFYLIAYIKDRQKFRMYVFVLVFVFFVCYLTYNILPVIGGRALPGMMELTQTGRYGLFTRIMAYIYKVTPHLGGAFPSSHVAIAVVVNLSAFNFSKKMGWIILPITILLSLSTVYCHYHYFIDTVFGLIYGIIFYLIGLRIYKYKPKAMNV